MSSDKILLVKGTAGLGNRLQCLLTGILYARLAGRQLIVDWRDRFYSSGNANSFYSFFQCPSARSTDVIPETDSVRPAIWRGHLRDSASSMRDHYGKSKQWRHWSKFSVDLRTLDYDEDVLVLVISYQQVERLRPHFTGSFSGLASQSDREILRVLFRDELKLQQQLQQRVEQLQQDVCARPTIGVHVRYTDHQVCLWAILKKLNSLLRQESDLQIFLSTDNLEIEHMFKRNYPYMITTPHWYPAKAGLPIHSDPTRPEPIESGNEALIDLYLLAKCHYLVIDTSSSFSYLATLLTNIPDANVFDVRRRGKLPARVRRVLHQGMLKTGLFSWLPHLVGRLVSTMNRCL